MTPMKRFKTSIDILRNHLSESSFKEKTINKAAPKHNPHGGEYGHGGYSKGVQNDFSFLFNYDQKFSIGLVFNYREEPIQIEATYCPKKISNQNRHADNENDKFESSPMFSTEEFRRHLNKLNKDIDELPKSERTPSSIVELFKKNFSVKKQNISQTMELAEERIKSFLEKKESKIKDKQENLNRKSRALKSANQKVNKSYDESDENQELLKIRERERELIATLKIKKEDLEKKYKVKEKVDEVFKAEREFFDLEKNEHIEKEKALKEFSKPIRNSVINRSRP